MSVQQSALFHVLKLGIAKDKKRKPGRRAVRRSNHENSCKFFPVEVLPFSKTLKLGAPNPCTERLAASEAFERLKGIISFMRAIGSLTYISEAVIVLCSLSKDGCALFADAWRRNRALARINQEAYRLRQERLLDRRARRGCEPHACNQRCA
jgi:hypothetical protein